MNGKKAKKIRRYAKKLAVNKTDEQVKTEGRIDYFEDRQKKAGTGEIVLVPMLKGHTRTLDRNGFKKIGRTLKGMYR